MKEIPVVYQDGMMDYVEPQLLQVLIENAGIIKFQRNDGWVYLGVDPVRKTSNTQYQGVERRLM